jgi:hypothetical protein
MYRKAFPIGLLILPYFFFLAGCAQPSVRLDVDGLAPDEISVVKTENKNIAIVFIDGEKTVGFMEYMLHEGQWAGEVSLESGKHRFQIVYDDGHRKSLYVYDVVTQVGGEYMIKHEIVNRSVFLWFEDLTTGKPVGKVFVSENEPLTDMNTTLDHSAYFTMRRPPDDGWTIMYRNSANTAFGKEGANVDETYGMIITLFTIPNFNSSDEFITFVREGREKDTDQRRFNITRDQLEYYEERQDYCVTYHFVAEDREAVKRSRNEDIMMLETVGYACRHPQNKNIGVNFDYSHRYYSGHRDEKLPTNARDAFELLTF